MMTELFRCCLLLRARTRTYVTDRPNAIAAAPDRDRHSLEVSFSRGYRPHRLNLPLLTRAEYLTRYLKLAAPHAIAIAGATSNRKAMAQTYRYHYACLTPLDDDVHSPGTSPVRHFDMCAMCRRCIRLTKVKIAISVARPESIGRITGSRTSRASGGNFIDRRWHRRRK